MFLRQFGFLFILTTLAFSQTAAADGGMYLPMRGKLPEKEMGAVGIKIPPSAIEKMANGTVAKIISPGCTATFLSPNGLLGTNWHCSEPCIDAIQNDAASKDANAPLAHVKENGYIATDFEKEISCPNYMVEVPIDVVNVSARFKDIEALPTIAADREEKIRYRSEQIREACMKGASDVVCKVTTMNNEKEPYYLYRYRRFTDIRLVWAPPQIIGYFGGETENWAYPRHTGDFSFLRVYKGNVPYASSNFAKVSPKGVKPTDATFILGYPGTTTRNITSYAADFMQSTALNQSHHVYQELLETLNAHFEDPLNSPYGSAWFALANYSENFETKAKTMKRFGVVEKMRQAEASVRDSTYLRQIQPIYHEASYFYPKLYLLGLVAGRGNPAKSFAAASLIWSNANQPADDKDRSDDRFKSWNRPSMVVSPLKRVDKSGTPEVEKALMAKFFELSDELSIPVQAFENLKARTRSVLQQCYREGKSSDFGLRFNDLCGENKSIYTQMADVLYAGTQMIAKDNSDAERKRAEEYRLGLLDLTAEQLARSNDLLIRTARGVVQELGGLRSDPEYGSLYTYELERLNRLENVMMGFDAPDANSTIRLTYSTVQENYTPIDGNGAKYPFCTTLSTMASADHFVKDENHADYPYFLVPDYIKQGAANPQQFKGQFFYDEMIKNVPVAFITKNTITGGNSGSSVFNGNGEVVGFAFDGTPESMLSDVWLHPEMRTIAVDMRYIGFLGTVALPDAKRVLREMGLPVSK